MPPASRYVPWITETAHAALLEALFSQEKTRSEDDDSSQSPTTTSMVEPWMARPFEHGAMDGMSVSHFCLGAGCCWGLGAGAFRFLHRRRPSEPKKGCLRACMFKKPCGTPRGCLVPRNFAKIFRFSVTSNLWTHACNIKYR
jgi:hypothetical protein